MLGMHTSKEPSSGLVLFNNRSYQMKTGNLSIHTENIFPIIKKFLYSNQEVFLRELISNAQDAT